MIINTLNNSNEIIQRREINEIDFDHSKPTFINEFNTTKVTDKIYLDFNENNNYEIYKFITGFLSVILIASLVITSIKFSKQIKKYFQRLFCNYQHVLTEDVENTIKETEHLKEHILTEDVENTIKETEHLKEHVLIEDVKNTIKETEHLKEHVLIEDVKNTIKETEHLKEHILTEDVENTIKEIEYLEETKI